MKDELKGKIFRDYKNSEIFQVELQLEEDKYNALLDQLISLDVKRPDFQIEYARLRGGLDILKSLKATREILIETARSRDPNS